MKNECFAYGAMNEAYGGGMRTGDTERLRRCGLFG
jgi:hypothetical protein